MSYSNDGISFGAPFFTSEGHYGRARMLYNIENMIREMLEQGKDMSLSAVDLIPHMHKLPPRTLAMLGFMMRWYVDRLAAAGQHDWVRVYELTGDSK